MPHFSAVVLDGLLESGSRNPNPMKPPPPPVNLRREYSYSEKKSMLHAISPILYATPDVTPLPDSPSSFSPSPYIVNHKRRGPRLLKTLSQTSVIGGGYPQPFELDGKVEVVGAVTGNREMPKFVEPEVVENGNRYGNGNGFNGTSENGVLAKEENGKSVDVEIERDAELDDFCDFLASMTTASSTEVDDIAGGERLWKPSTPVGEYYDAFEELSCDSARSSCQNVEVELHEMRLNLLTEIERRKQAEEALENFQSQWQSLCYHLSLVGLTLPALPAITDDTTEQPNFNPAEDLYQQVLVARFVAGSVVRGCSQAEVAMEMEPQIQAKNFEIARLSDRLQYYEAANREMSQRNQEAVEMARQHRHRRKRRQKWFWSSIGLAVTLGTAAIMWSYIPASKPSPHECEAPNSHSD